MCVIFQIFLLIHGTIVTTKIIGLTNIYKNKISSPTPFTTFENCLIKLITGSTKNSTYNFQDELEEISYFYNTQTVTPTINRDMFQWNDTNPNGWENKPIRNFARITRKFTSCYAYFYLQEMMDFVVSNQFALFKLVTWYTSFQKENQDYLIISTNTIPQDHIRDVYSIEPWAHKLFMSHARVIFLRQGLYSQLLCITCLVELGSTRSDLIFENVTDMDIIAIDKLAVQIHRNLRKALVVHNAYTALASCSPIMKSITLFECAQEPSLTHFALWDGMDLISWILVFISASLVILALKLVNKRGAPTVSPLRIVVVFLMLEQGLLPSRNSLKILGKKAAFMVSLWALMCVVISNGYKGNIFSLLTAISSPQVPQNMDQILELNTSLITRAAYRSGNGQIKSLIHYTIFELKQQGSLKYHLNDTISRLSNKVAFTSAQTSEIAFSQTGPGVKSNATYSHVPRKIPQLAKTYIYIGDAEDVSLYSMLLAVTKKKPLILQGPTIDLFWQRLPILVLRNFFTEAYTQVALRIVESGLWYLWGRYEEMHWNLQEMKKFIQLEISSNLKSSNVDFAENMLPRKPGQRRWNILGLIWSKSIFSRGTKVVDSLKTEAFTVVFVFFAAGILLGIACFIFEKCFSRLTGTTTTTPVFVF
ncbi:unnamed protein product [Allacma fusca]|uniref:Uncharacterized protein n=1 Tax=Allacma fusca TaxID=39272 RepID=A0A8J2PHP2_9HEXA|nr:unnamed protein product [Allacma fusca]